MLFLFIYSIHQTPLDVRFTHQVLEICHALFVSRGEESRTEVRASFQTFLYSFDYSNIFMCHLKLKGKREKGKTKAITSQKAKMFYFKYAALYYLSRCVNCMLLTFQQFRVILASFPEQENVPDLSSIWPSGYDAFHVQPILVPVDADSWSLPQPHSLVGSVHTGHSSSHMLHVACVHFHEVLLHIHLLIEIRVYSRDVVAF